VLAMFRKDPATKAVAMIGEIGGNAEEMAAEYVRKTKYPKPIAAYIAGRAAPPGKRMGHAGAIITGKAGTAETKIDALRDAGVRVALKPGEIAKLLKRR
ncbi:MAG: succinate--CoA ligase subunit alpha, partial [Candidatus Bathyarchaeia archaeon]